MGYLRRASDKIPTGHVVVHNRVRPTTMSLVTRGFRAWAQVLDDSLILCDCGWAAGVLRAHYMLRVHYVKRRKKRGDGLVAGAERTPGE